MLKVVTLKEIERVLEIIDDLGLSREAVVIPLKPAHPGTVRLRPDERLEIVLDSEASLDDSLGEIRCAIEALLAGDGGDRVRRADE